MKELRSGEAVRMLTDGKLKPATILEKAHEPRCYILKSDDTFKDMKQEESEVNDTNK